MSTAKIICVSIILFLTLASGIVFFYFKSLLSKYADQPLESIEKKIKQTMGILIGILITMIIVTIITIIYSK